MSSSDSAAASPAAPSGTYSGSCHCGRFKYSVTQSPPLTDPSCEVMDCNCSICSRNGYLFLYVPDKNITWEKGSVDELTVRSHPPHRTSNHPSPAFPLSVLMMMLIGDV